MQQIQLRSLAELFGERGHHPAGVLAGFDRHVRQIGDLQRVLDRTSGKSQKTGEQIERQAWLPNASLTCSRSSSPA